MMMASVYSRHTDLVRVVSGRLSSWEEENSGSPDEESGGSRVRFIFGHDSSFTFKSARKASCGTSTRPSCFIRFLPSFCFSHSLRFRVMSPP